MADVQYLHCAALDEKQDPVGGTALSKQQFSDFLAEIICFRRQGTSVLVPFERINRGPETREPAISRRCRTLLVKPSQHTIDIPAGLRRQSHAKSHANSPGLRGRICEPAPSGHFVPVWFVRL